MEIKGKEIIASDGKYIHRKGSNSYFKRCILLKDETEADFEEVDSIPELQDSESYKEQVISKVRERYTIDDELAILRQRDTKPDEFNEYFKFAEQVKKEVKDAQSNPQR